jgi:hypothetical protein
VNLAGITGAALAFEDSAEERAWIVAAAQRYTVPPCFRWN